MPTIFFGRKPNRISWCAVLGAMLLSACGGGTADNGSGERNQGSANSAVGAPMTDGDPQASQASAQGGWYFCANEWATCTLNGTRLIRYGAEGRYAYRSATSSIACDNSVFGDPAPGLAKTCSISSTPSPYKQDAMLYELSFRDDFSGSSLDTRKWTDHIWYEQSALTQDYGVGNGYLKIWPQADANGKFNSRILTTHQKFSQAYGYFEMEAKLPVGRGVWPAFWLLNSDNPDAGEPEIDIMEAYSGGKLGTWADENQHPIAFGASYYRDGNGHTADEWKGTQDYATGDLSTGFHKYAVKWEPDQLSYYFDGKLFYTAKVSMSKKMYLLIDIQYGAESGQVDSTTPLGPDNSLQVNYIRAWQFKPAS